MKKKILVFMFRLAGGGAERTVINIMNNLNRDLFEVLLVLGTNERNEYLDFISKDIKVINLSKKKLRYSIIGLRKIIIQENPDLVFSTLNDNNLVLLLTMITIRKRIPVYVRETNNRSESKKVSQANRKITTYLYNKAEKVVALSEGVKQDLIENFNIDSNIIELIYNPVEIDKINEMSKQKISDMTLQCNKKIIVASGRLVEQKDFITLIKGFSILLEKVDSYLIILGKGPQLEKLKDICRELNVFDKVIFMGFKKNPYKYLKLADLFVLSSKWEGFGHVIVEAMALGVPVISSNCKSGPSEIIGNNEYGLLFPVGDHNDLATKMLGLLTGNEINTLAIKGMKRAKDFEAKKIVREYEKMFTNY